MAKEKKEKKPKNKLIAQMSEYLKFPNWPGLVTEKLLSLTANYSLEKSKFPGPLQPFAVSYVPVISGAQYIYYFKIKEQ